MRIMSERVLGRKEGGAPVRGSCNETEQNDKVHLRGQSKNTRVISGVVMGAKGGVQVKHLAFHLSNWVIREPFSQNQETGRGTGWAGMSGVLFGTRWLEYICRRARRLCEVCS